MSAAEPPADSDSDANPQFVPLSPRSTTPSPALTYPVPQMASTAPRLRPAFHWPESDSQEGRSSTTGPPSLRRVTPSRAETAAESTATRRLPDTSPYPTSSPSMLTAPAPTRPLLQPSKGSPTRLAPDCAHMSAGDTPTYNSKPIDLDMLHQSQKDASISKHDNAAGPATSLPSRGSGSRSPPSTDIIPPPVSKEPLSRVQTPSGVQGPSPYTVPSSNQPKHKYPLEGLDLSALYFEWTCPVCRRFFIGRSGRTNHTRACKRDRPEAWAGINDGA